MAEHKGTINAKPNETKEMNIWQIATAVLALLLIVSVFYIIYKSESAPVSPINTTPATPGTTPAGMTAQQVADKTIKYINENIIQGRGNATLKGTNETNGLYEVTITIAGNDYPTYATKDGKLLFVQSIDMNTPVTPAAQPTPQTMPKTNKPTVQLYTMAYCPYGNQAEGVTQPVVTLLGSKVEIEPHYVIYANYQGGGPNYCFDNESKYCSMHGAQEIHEDVRELCIFKYQKDKFWAYIAANDATCTAQNADSCWEAVANSTGIDTGKVKSCYNSEAISLLQNEVDLNTKYGVQGSPMLIINGVEYSGDRTPEGYKQGICGAFNSPPSECNTTLSSAGGTTTGGCG